MSTFYLWVRQAGEGCDYTVGCGQLLIELDAHDLDAAQAEAEQRIMEDYVLEGDDELAEARLLQLAQIADLPRMRQTKIAQRRAEERAETERREREELERLQRKYGGKK